MERYSMIEPKGVTGAYTLGQGAYGVVFKALDKETGDFVALKRIKMETEFDGVSSATIREIGLLIHLQHPNVVRLLNVMQLKNCMNLIYELVDFDLKKHMDQCEDELPMSTVKSFMSQLLSGLHYLHSNGIMHRDLKPPNLLISKEGQLKIADFGLARSFTPFQRDLTVEVITRWYRPPEILLGCDSYTCSVDLWSVGCILAELCNKAPLFTTLTDIEQIHKIFQMLGTPHEDLWPEAADLPHFRSNLPFWVPLKLELFVPRLAEHSDGLDLLEKLLIYNPKNRISARQALSHPFLTGSETEHARGARSPGAFSTPVRSGASCSSTGPQSVGATDRTEDQQSTADAADPQSDLFEPNTKRRRQNQS